MQANVYICGPRDAILALSNSMEIIDELKPRKASKAARDLWYLDFPSFTFSVGNFAADICAYLDKYAHQLRRNRPDNIELSVLSVRIYPSIDGSYDGFFLDDKLIGKLSELNLSFDCNIQFVSPENLPNWT